MNVTITLQDYLAKNKAFYIPNYQRGYVWGKRNLKGKDSVSYMMESLLNGYRNDADIFIQGVTVSENNTQIILIDGQQRTTFFYLLLKFLEYKAAFTIHYGIRSESDNFLSNIDCHNINYTESADDKFQDIFFFKKTLRLIREQLSEDIDKEAFLSYLLDRVKFLYIDIPYERAVKVFSMMNGNKAEMQQEELIKAELLRLSSLNDSTFEYKPEKEKYAIEWDNNMLRSRYAREWDKWLQWWNREDVKSLFKTDNVMGLLISTYYHSISKGQALSYAEFRDCCLKEGMPINAKKTFYNLRCLQKQFEDAFNSPIVYNKIGAIIRIINNKDAFIRWFFNIKKKISLDELDRYYRLAFIQMTHNEIIEQEREASEEIFNKKFNQLYDCLKDNNLYNKNPQMAFQLLLRLNIDEDNKQNVDEDNKAEKVKGRFFDFSIWDRKDSRGRSLEHIYPKSKVWHKENTGDSYIIKNGNGDICDIETVQNDSLYISRESCKWNEEIASEHSIGNLVLLYKDDNSAFNDSFYDEKKSLFFKNNVEKNKDIFKSRHLLHTIYKFANPKWDGEEIAKNKYFTLKEFREYYGK